MPGKQAVLCRLNLTSSSLDSFEKIYRHDITPIYCMNRHLPNCPANNFTIVCFYLQAHTNRQHGGVLYEIMEKPFTVSRTAIYYEGKFFVPVTNTENGEVNDRTLTDTGH